MAELLSLRGRNALSPFRVAKLLSTLSGFGVSSISAEYWHFAHIQRPLTAQEKSTLESLLRYGPRSESTDETGQLFLVLPRPGTISPWSSKATDIARNCGLDAVSRIERGIAFHVVSAAKQADDSFRERVAAALHDRMTEAVFAALPDAERLFQDVPPQRMTSIDLMRRGPEALEE